MNPAKAGAVLLVSGYFGVQKDATGQLREDFGMPSGIFPTRRLQIGSRLEF